MVSNRQKFLIAVTFLFALFISTYFLFTEQNWMKGLSLNPFQIDEIEMIREDTLYGQIGIQIHDKGFIKRILRDLKEAEFVQQSFSFNNDLAKGERFLLLARDGQNIKMHAEIYSGKNNGFSNEATMLIGDQYYYQLPNSIKRLFQLEPNELALEVNKGTIWINWLPFVVIEGQPFYKYNILDTGNDIKFKEEFVIKKTLPSPTRLPINEEPKKLLEDRIASSDPINTVVYKADDMYFSIDQKELNRLSVLLPYGQSAHDLNLEPTQEVEFWSSHHTSYFIVRSEDGVLVLSAQDPATPKESLLKWDNEKRQFISPNSSVTYSKTGQPSKSGFAPMQILPSKVWRNIILFSHY